MTVTCTSGQSYDHKMADAIKLCFLVLILGVVCAVRTEKITFTNQYAVLGTLSLPYAEIVEPFIAYFDGPGKRARVDYYNGMVEIFQRGDLGKYGVTYKIAPMTTETILNHRSCFMTNGTAKTPIKLQSLLPDISDFKIIGEDERLGTVCIKLQKVEMKGLKKNTYTMWVTKDKHVPVRYEMLGYDTLLGSHYDRYYVEYAEYAAGAPPIQFFHVPNNSTCGPFPGPGASSHIENNPMREYIHNDDRHVHEMFNEFKTKHEKQYSSGHEHEQRKNNFRNNLRYIHSKNRAGLSYRLGLNHMMDRSASEIKTMNGYRYTPGNHGGLKFNVGLYTDVPASIDWRLFGAVTPVKDQAVCGSCWSFGTTGTIEGAYFKKTGKLVRLSQQELMDCSWGEGNNACDGGEDFRAYAWIKKHGLSSEEKYGPYLGQDSLCHYNDSTPVVHIKSFVNVTPYNVDALKAAIANHGPVSVAMDASHKSLSFYANGVYYEPECKSKPDQLDHAVLAVGYGTMKNQTYWLIKNSWSTHWGNNGYFLIAQKDNNCGIMTDATFVTL